MKVKELKLLLKHVPDNVEVTVNDMEDFSSDFELGTYYDGDSYIDIIIPIHIGRYNREDSAEEVIVY